MEVILEERFSTLSNDIVIKILDMTGSYKTAVRCSAVSRRFKNLYTLLPCLNFTREELIPHPYMPRSGPRLHSFHEIVKRALDRHTAELDLLSFKAIRELEGNEIIAMFRYASALKAKHLRIDSDTLETFHFVLSFPCEKVHSLSLNQMVLFPFFGLNGGFPHLETLSLHECLVSDHLQKLVSKSPALQHLEVFDCTLGTFEVWSSSLTSVKISNCTTIGVVNAPGDFAIDCPNIKELSVDYSLVKELGSVSCPETLKIENVVIFPGGLSCRFVSAILDLVVELANVKSLQVSFSSPGDCQYPRNSGDAHSQEDEEKDVDPIVGLEQVLLKTFKLRKQEKYLISQLLEKCPALAVIQISLDTALPEEEYAWICEEISGYRKASVDVAISINGKEITKD